MLDQGTHGVGAHAAPAFSQSKVLLCSCAAAATAAYLGASWLRTPVFGLPTGIWCVAIAQGAAAALDQRRRSRARAAQLAPALDPARIASFDVGLAAGRVGAALLDFAHHVAGSIGVEPGRLSAFEERLTSRLDGLSSTPAPLRIGIDGPPDTVRALASATSQTETRWLAVGGGDPASQLRRHALDAIIRHRPHESLTMTTSEHPGKEAAWYDWALPRPLTYASLFPARLDAAQVTIDDFDPADPSDTPLIAAMARAAAALSRNAARLSLADRLRGRHPDPALPQGTPSLSESCLSELAHHLVNSSGSTPSVARRAAARVVSAWLSAADGWLDMNFRRSGVEAALAVLGDEPEVLLRAAAVRFAACDDRSGLDALVRAERVIRSSHQQDAADHLPFLQAEVELGLPGPMTLGRVAAAICLVCATSPASRLPYIRGDFMDDARYSAWLVGRDQDRAVLVEVFRALEEGRTTTESAPMRRAA